MSHHEDAVRFAQALGEAAGLTTNPTKESALDQPAPILKLEEIAWGIAATAHEGQRYGGGPYIVHLELVVGVLREFNEERETMLAAGWLHDVLEDTDTSPADLCRTVGVEVTALVKGVTNEGGKNRAERNAATYPKIRSRPDFVRLKLADRIANVRFGGREIEMYRKEYLGFRAALWRDREWPDMWAELDRLLLAAPAAGKQIEDDDKG